MDIYAAERILEARKQKVLKELGTINSANIRNAHGMVQQWIGQAQSQFLPSYLSEEEVAAHTQFKQWLLKIQKELFAQEAQCNAAPQVTTLPSGLQVESITNSTIDGAMRTANTIQNNASIFSTMNSLNNIRTAFQPYEYPFRNTPIQPIGIGNVVSPLHYTPVIPVIERQTLQGIVPIQPISIGNRFSSHVPVISIPETPKFQSHLPFSLLPETPVIAMQFERQSFFPSIQIDRSNTAVGEPNKGVIVHTRDRIIFVPLPSFSFGFFLTNGQFNWTASLPDLARIAIAFGKFDEVAKCPRICVQGKPLTQTSFKADAKYKAFENKHSQMMDFELAQQVIAEILSNTDKCSAMLKEIREVAEGRSDGTRFLAEAIQ